MMLSFFTTIFYPSTRHRTQGQKRLVRFLTGKGVHFHPSEFHVGSTSSFKLGLTLCSRSYCWHSKVQEGSGRCWSQNTRFHANAIVAWQLSCHGSESNRCLGSKVTIGFRGEGRVHGYRDQDISRSGVLFFIVFIKAVLYQDECEVWSLVISLQQSYPSF